MQEWCIVPEWTHWCDLHSDGQVGPDQHLCSCLSLLSFPNLIPASSALKFTSESHTKYSFETGSLAQDYISRIIQIVCICSVFSHWYVRLHWVNIPQFICWGHAGYCLSLAIMNCTAVGILFCFFQFFSLGKDWHTSLFKFKVYSMMVWFRYIMNDYNRFS